MTELDEIKEEIAITEGKLQAAEDAGSEHLIVTYGNLLASSFAKAYLDKFKLVASGHPNPTSTNRFPNNHFGKVLLYRNELIDHLAKVVIGKPVGVDHFRSHYFRGLPGSGKTSIAVLLGHKLQDKLGSYVVYYFENSKDLESLEVDKFKACIASVNKEGKTVVFLVDEADQNPKAARWTTLLKPESRNLITIGFGVSVPEGIFFDVEHLPREVCYSVDNKRDIQEVVDYWKKELPHINETVIMEICCYVCTYTSGQSFAFLKIVELLLTEYADSLGVRRNLVKREEATRALAAGSYQHYLSSDAAFAHQVVQDVKSRCFRNHVVQWFHHFKNVTVPNAADDHSSLVESLVLLEKYGFWDKEIRCFFSLLLHRVVLNTVREKVSPDDDNRSDIDTAKPNRQDIFRELIARGLARMTDDNFTEARVGDAISSAWAYHISATTKNVSVSPQSRGVQSGHVDYVFNKEADVAIKVVKESCSSETGIKNMNLHVDRLVSGKYPWKHNAVLNFNMKTAEVIFPSKDNKYPIDQVFTYVHLTRQLFRGKTEVVVPGGVVPRLKVPAAKSRCKVTFSSFSTLVARGAPRTLVWAVKRLV